jgi:hypothetical protein
MATKQPAKAPAPASIAAIATAATAATAAPTKPAPTPKGLVCNGAMVTAITLTGAKPYRVKAAHNVAFVEALQKLQGTSGNVPATAALAVNVQGCVTPTMLGYMLRHGYALPVVA